MQPETDAFERIAGLLDYPMFIVTTRVGDERAGCLVGFAGQVSIRPARFMVGLSKRNRTYRASVRGATHLAVHLVNRQHRDLARLFGSETGDLVDKFANCSWHDGPEGLPILSDAAAWFTARVRSRFDMGDHVGHLTEPVTGWSPPDLGELVTYADVKDLQPGHQA